jgi:hypothetical protein
MFLLSLFISFFYCFCHIKEEETKSCPRLSNTNSCTYITTHKNKEVVAVREKKKSQKQEQELQRDERGDAKREKINIRY